MNKTYSIPAENLPGLLDKLHKLNRRAAKLGLPEIQHAVGAESFLDGIGEGGHRYKYKVVEVTITGETVKLSGWTLQAVVQWLDGQPIYRTVPGQQVDATGRESYCDHCRTERYRRDTYLVRHDDGTVKQVGSTCLHDFLGVDPHQLTAWFEFQSAADDLFNVGGSGTTEKYFDLQKVLAFTSVVISACGWKSRTKAKEDGSVATADHVASCLFDRTGKVLEKVAGAESPDMLEIQRAIDWAAALSPRTDEDYLHNIKTIAGAGLINYRLLGLACSILPSYRREIERERLRRARAEEWSASEHFGTVGKRELFDLELLSVRMINGQYGLTYIHTFRHAGRDLVVWFGSSNHASGKELPEMIRVKATVKAHGQFNGAKQTVLTRVALT